MLAALGFGGWRLSQLSYRLGLTGRLFQVNWRHAPTLTAMIELTMSKLPCCFTPFTQAIDAYELPARFTFPFYYEPHPLCVLAANELQQHLDTQRNWQHNFGLTGELQGAIGKMFGVLLVQSATGELGYLAAFSGKLAEQNHWPRFVPPVFDMLAKDTFFKAENLQINQLNQQIAAAEQQPQLGSLTAQLTALTAQAEAALNAQRALMSAGRERRKALRLALAALVAEAPTEAALANQAHIEATLSRESVSEKTQLRQLKRHWDEQLQSMSDALANLIAARDKLKCERKQLSAALQHKLFEQYRFLNILGDEKSL
ncbi:MAG: hypothetical protein ACRDBI_10225, partial [Shewanella sp.]